MRLKDIDAFRDRDAFYSPHFLIGGQQQIDLALDGNLEGIFQERILPGVDVSFFRRERHVFTFGQRRGLRNGDGFCRAGLHPFAGQAIGGSKSPGPAGDHANSDA